MEVFANLTRNMYKQFKIQRHNQTKHATDKLSAEDHAEKVKQHEAVLASQQHFFMQVCESMKIPPKQTMKGPC